MSRIRFLAAIAPLSLSAYVAACDSSPTRPVSTNAMARSAPRVADHIVGGGSGWTLVSLPFRPSAINDAGVIVGEQNGYAVRWQNGNITQLPGVIGYSAYDATAISPSGMIAGTAEGNAMLWTSPGKTPQFLATNITYPMHVVGINDDTVVVGTYSDTHRTHVWRWTPATHFHELESDAEVTGLSGNGIASGYVFAGVGQYTPVYWDLRGAIHYLPFVNAGGQANAISSTGSMAGNSMVACGLGFCPSTLTVWNMAGVLTAQIMPPTTMQVRGLNTAGRIVGDAAPQPLSYLNGSFVALSNPDMQSPHVMGVNNCGSVIAQRHDVPNTGYYWRRGSAIAPACDAMIVKSGA